MAEENDAALVRRARAGDRRAFDLLMRRHQDRAWMLARGIVRNPTDAEDVVQEAFIAVLRNIETFAEHAQFSTWLHRIVVRKAYDHLRKRVPEPLDPASTPVATVAAMHDGFTQHLAKRDLLVAISTLDENFRNAVLLVDILGVSVDEAAGVLDVAPGTIKSRVFRGRAALAAHLGTLGHDGASEQ